MKDKSINKSVWKIVKNRDKSIMNFMNWTFFMKKTLLSMIYWLFFEPWIMNITTTNECKINAMNQLELDWDPNQIKKDKKKSYFVFRSQINMIFLHQMYPIQRNKSTTVQVSRVKSTIFKIWTRHKNSCAHCSICHLLLKLEEVKTSRN